MSQLRRPPAPAFRETVDISSAVPHQRHTAANEHTAVKSPIAQARIMMRRSPATPPAFVKVGDSVEPGQVLCIIESMKLMNEIESEIAGTPWWRS